MGVVAKEVEAIIGDVLVILDLLRDESFFEAGLPREVMSEYSFTSTQNVFFLRQKMYLFLVIDFQFCDRQMVKSLSVLFLFYYKSSAAYQIICAKCQSKCTSNHLKRIASSCNK